MAKSKGKKGKVRYSGGAMVLAPQGEMMRPTSGGPMLREAPSELLYQAGAIGLGRKLLMSEYEKKVAQLQATKKKGEEVTEAEKKDIMRGLGWKAMGLGYVGIRTFEKGDMTGAGSYGAFVNGVVMLSDSIG